MSKVNDLIKKLCPKGVEYLELYKVVKWNKRFTGVDKQWQKDVFSTKSDISAQELKSLIVDDGNVKLLSTGIFDGYTNNDIYSGNIDNNEVITIPSGGTANIKYYNGAFINSGNILATSIDNDKYYLKYIYYCLINKKELVQSYYRGSSVQHPDMKQIIQIKIPVPPIEIQKEIVRILDKFSELEVELEVELEAELEARKGQYEFWRGKVFNNIDAKTVKLSSLCKIGDGLHGTPEYSVDGDYYFINGNNLINGKIVFDSKTKKVSKIDINNQNVELNKNTLLMSINGTIGKVAYYNAEKIMLGKSVAYFNILDDNVLSKKYLFYLLQSPNSIRYYNDSLTGSTILNLGLKALREFEIPLPTIDEQNKIANILEHFERLINDISIGLPAEIELRRKQYEYYRDKLLSFKELLNE